MIALAQQSNILDEVIHGEALAVLRTLPDNSVDAIVCDPPAGISFMGKEWDNYSGKEKTYNSAGARAAANADKEKLKRIGQGTTPYGFSSSSGQTTKKERDAFISFLTAIMAEALRVLKPGGHAFVWALPRTSHWTGIALEDAGFEIRDVVTHLFGSGFPKSHDISAAIDKMQGAEREVVGVKPAKHSMGRMQESAKEQGARQYKKGLSEQLNVEKYGGIPETAPATPEASQWNGWGTALKPSSEHWWLCRKPLSEPTIAANVLKWGTGALNIDASRVGYANKADLANTQAGTNRMKNSVIGNNASQHHEGWVRPWMNDTDKLKSTIKVDSQGRWPANLLLSHSVWCVPNGVKKVKGNGGGWNDLGNTHRNAYSSQGWSPDGINRQNSEGMEQVEDWLCDESCPIRLLDEQSGMRGDSYRPNGMHGEGAKSKSMFFDGTTTNPGHMGYSDRGGSSRYFQRFSPFIYQAKASRSERNRGCEGLPTLETRIVNNQNCKVCTECGKHLPNSYMACSCGGSLAITEVVNPPRMNSHPTVKPLALCRYLVRMITPPGGIVLDCFAGSGSTLVAAIHEGMHFIGIEMNDSEQEPYISIARARIEQAFREVQS